MKGRKKAIRSARELFRLCQVNGVVDHARARSVARELAASSRRGAVAVLVEFYRLVRLDRERHTALVESAVPLAGSLRTTIQRGLARAYDDTLETSFGEDPDLIGGVRIKVGSDVYDGSVRARLNALIARL